MIKLGFIGLGAIGLRHVDAALKCEQTSIVAVCSKSSYVKGLPEKLGRLSPELYSDYKKMLDDVPLDAVVVSLPPSEHYDVVLYALNHKIHVLCEKPPAMTASQALEMFECAKKNEVHLMYAFMFRFSEKHFKAAEIVQSGILGKINLVRLETIRRFALAGSWYGNKAIAGGGCVIDIGSHCLDLARFIIGGDVRPVSVYAKTFPPCPIFETVKSGSTGWIPRSSDSHDYDVEEAALAIINLSNGAVVELLLSNALHIKQNFKRIEFIGTEAGLEVDPELELHTVDNGELKDVHYGIAGFDYQGSLDSQMKCFIDLLNKSDSDTHEIQRKGCLSSAFDGWVLMKLVDAIYESAETGRFVNITW